MLMNAFVLYTMSANANSKKLPPNYTAVHFVSEWLESLDEGLCQGENDADCSSASGDESSIEIDYKDHRRSWWQGDSGTSIRMDRRFHALQHAGNVYYSRLEVNGEEKRADLRRNCMYCGERTIYFCEVCKVPLCIGACNKNFHTQRKLPQMQRLK
jgi:hypothetical protein